MKTIEQILAEINEKRIIIENVAIMMAKLTRPVLRHNTFPTDIFEGRLQKEDQRLNS